MACRHSESSVQFRFSVRIVDSVQFKIVFQLSNGHIPVHDSVPVTAFRNSHLGIVKISSVLALSMTHR